jgi:hypothetical protein
VSTAEAYIATLTQEVGGQDGIYRFLNDQYHKELYTKAFEADQLLRRARRT